MEIDLRAKPTFKEVREYFKRFDISVVDGKKMEALKAENEELKIDLSAEKMFHDSYKVLCETKDREIAELKAKLDKAMRALKYYKDLDDSKCGIPIDLFERARKTLEEM